MGDELSFERFIEAGIYDPAARNAHERRELLEHLVGRGFSVDEIIRVGSGMALFTDLPAVLSLGSQPRVPLDVLAAQLNVTVEELVAVRSALGFDGKTPPPEHFAEDFALYQLGCEQYGREPVLAFLRVVGSAVTTMMEAGRKLFAGPLHESAATELQIAQANELALAAWYQLADVIGHVMFEKASVDIWFEEAILHGDLRAAIAFVDLVDSTAWTASIATPQHAAALGRFERTAASLAVDHGGRVVKFIGDEAMIAARTPDAAVAIAHGICAATRADEFLPAARGAVGYGEVTVRDGDYFGPLVNLVARATKVAAPGGVVVTAEVAEALAAASWSAAPLEPVALRGVGDAVPLFAVEPRAG